MLKQRFLGNVPDFIRLHLLHANMDIVELENFINQQNECKDEPAQEQHHQHQSRRKNPQSPLRIILATEFAESLSTLKRIRYIIDAGRLRRCVQNNNSQSKEYIYEWVSRQTLDSRLQLLDEDVGMSSVPNLTP